MKNVRRSAMAAGLAMGLVAGGAAGAVLGVPGISGAQETTTTTTVAEPDSSTPEKDSGFRETVRAKLDERLTSALDPLVQDGTIDQSQADAVVDTLLDSEALRGPGRDGRGGPGRHGHGFFRGDLSEAVISALGTTEEELRDALRDGQTLAQIAEANGVDPQVVIDALVQERTAQIEAAVESGRLTREQADEKLADLTERVTTMVNEGGPRHRGGWHHKNTDKDSDSENSDEGGEEDGEG